MDALMDIWVMAALLIFPICLVVTFVVAILKPRVGRFIDSRPELKRRYDSIVEAGPKEGWSGYVIFVVVMLFLFFPAIMLLLNAG